MKPEIAKRVQDAEALAANMLSAVESGFVRSEDNALDIDKAKELSAESNRLLEALVNDVKAMDTELDTATKRVAELEPKVNAADAYIKQATDETRRFMNIVAKAKKDEAKLTEFNKRVEEKSITLEEVVKLGNEARQEYYDMFPPAVVSRAFDPDACPSCGTDRGVDEKGEKRMECANCGTKFEAEKRVEEKAKTVVTAAADLLPESSFSTKK